MGYLDTLEHWRFDDIPLAVESASVKIGIRTHKHVYPHSPGAVSEKLGREPYEISVDGWFDVSLPQDMYPNPMEAFQSLRLLTDTETTSDLTIPWIGTLKAYCERITPSETNKIRSGIKYSAMFVEDTNNEYALATFVRVDRKPLADNNADFSQKAPSLDIFAKIDQAVSFVLGIKDQSELYSNLVDSKLRYLENLFRYADSTLSELRDPANILMIDSFFRLWESVRELGDDISAKGKSFKYYTVPAVSTLQEVADAIPGYSTKAIDLLGLNVIIDSNAIKAGTRIRYYEL